MLIGDFELIRWLGRGDMGLVRAARSRSQNRLVAIVPIPAFGEHDECPYIILKLIDEHEKSAKIGHA